MGLSSRPLSLCFVIFCNLFLISHSLEFAFNGFNTSGVTMGGSTDIEASGALRLTPKTPNLIGHAFHRDPIPMFNSSPNASSFSTCFVFQILPDLASRGGFGFAFTLSPSPGFPGAEGGHYLGVFNSTNDGSSANHIFLVEFDTVNGYNEELDKDGNHVGINIDGMTPVASDSATYSVNGTRAKEEIDLESGDPVQAWIEYDGFGKLLNVTIAPIDSPKPIIPLLSESIDLSKVVKDSMYAGFSAATGQKYSSHYILGWSFKLNGIADPLNIDRLPFVPNVKSSSTSNVKLKNALIATFSVIIFLLLLALGGIFVYRRVLEFEHLEDWELECPRRFRYKDLYKATKGFKESEIIGIGGFGAVYRGVLEAHGTEVAVKKIMSNNALQGLREFAAEIESLGRLRHKNLVNLQGWCKHKKDLLLVYDYVPNGSLDSLLYTNSENGKIILNWEQRFSIIKGIASGLLYLHEEWERVVIHRDVKSPNVLIDAYMNARLGDFGLARLYDHGKNSHTTNVVGTIGYIAPELTRTGKASTSTDVFAFGILLLEVACGRRPVVCEAARNVILVDWVVECMQVGNIYDAVDPRLGSNYVSEEMEMVLGLGLLCSHPRAETRPTMRQVMRYLNGDEVLPVFDHLSASGSRRVDEITSRFLSLGLSESIITPVYNSSSSVGRVSTGSFHSGR
ncbi:lectin-domain containing receptor kinase VI.3-like [Dorcoceras hygrometricum]|uniref:non-specific serine/threonine protein kinase n=1 Tax=Dorcoceras hygrometricum TaxID=472368 RepID=A0A2Z7BFK2_9LAMI|nr:lectin-domain containing receptor kinase VI.3-like [Dorcoceras hygrometricum]